MMGLPGKFKRNPFIVWGFVVATVAIFVFLFGQGEVMDIIRWAIGMNELVVPVAEGN